MKYEDPIKAAKLYNSLLQDGYTSDNLGSEDEFVRSIEDPNKAKSIYSALISDGYTSDNIGDEESFLSTFVKKAVQPEPEKPAFQSVNPERFSKINEAIGKLSEIDSKVDESTGMYITPSGKMENDFIKAVGSNEKKKIADTYGPDGISFSRLYEDFKDMPDGAPVDLVKYEEELKDNPESYARSVASLKWQRYLSGAIVSKDGSDLGEKVYSRLIQMQRNGGSYDNRKAFTNELIKTVRSYVDDTELQEKIIKNIAIDRAESYGSQLAYGNENDFLQHPLADRLNKYQVGYLEFLESFDPLKADAYKKTLGIDQELVKATTPGASPEMIIGYEREAREAEAGGLLLALNTVKEDIVKFTKNTSAESMTSAEAAQFKTLIEKYDEIVKEVESQPDRYPTTKAVEINRMMQEALGESKNSFGKRFLLGVGQGVDNTMSFVETIGYKVFGSDSDLAEHELRQIGASEIYEGEQSYLPNSNSFFQKGEVFDFSSIQDKIDQINNSTLSGEQKQAEMLKLMGENYANIKTVQNPNSGKINWTATAMMEGMNSVVSQMIPMVATSYGFTPSSAGKMAQFRSVFMSSFMSTYEQSKVQNIKNKVKNPELRAFITTVITSAAEGMNLDLPMFKKMFGQKGGLMSKIATDITEEEWNAAVKASTGGFRNKVSGYVKSAGGNMVESIKESFTEGLGSGADAAVGNIAFGEDNDPVKTGSDDFILSMVGFGIPSLAGVPFRSKNLGMETKHAIWEIGADAQKFRDRIQKQFELGEIDQAAADHWNTVIDRSENAVNSTPPLKANGKPLSDSQKASYAFNLFVLEETGAQADAAPEPIKKKLDEVTAEVDAQNNDIVSGKDDERIVKDAEKVLKGEPEQITQPIELDPRLPEDMPAEVTQPAPTTPVENTVPARDVKEIDQEITQIENDLADIQVEMENPDADVEALNADYEVGQQRLEELKAEKGAVAEQVKTESGVIKKRSAKDLGNATPEEVMFELSNFFPEKSKLLNEAIDVTKRMREIDEKGGGKMFTGESGSIKYPFPYRVYSQEINSRKSTPEKKQEAWDNFETEVEIAKEYIKNAPSDELLAERKAVKDAEAIAKVESIKKTQAEAKKRVEEIDSIKKGEKEFISKFSDKVGRSIPILIADGVSKRDIEIIDDVAKTFEKHDPGNKEAFGSVSSFFEKNGYGSDSVSKLIEKIKSADVDLFKASAKDAIIADLEDKYMNATNGESNNGSYTGTPIPEKIDETQVEQVPGIPTYFWMRPDEYTDPVLLKFHGYKKEGNGYSSDDFDSELWYGEDADGNVDEYEYFSIQREPTYKHIKKAFGKDAADQWLAGQNGKEEVPVKDEDVFTQPKKPINFVTKMSKQPVLKQEQANEVVLDWINYARELGKTNANNNKVIISLFDYTGNWAKGYHDAGYTTIQFDIQHAEGGKVKHKKPQDLDPDGADAPDAPGMFSEEDIVAQLKSGNRRIKIGMDLWKGYPDSLLMLKRILKDNGYSVEGILAAPPCTSFAGSGARWWEDQHDGGPGNSVLDQVMARYGQEVLRRFDSPVEFNKMLVDVTEEWFRVLDPTLFYAMENPRGRIKSVVGLPDPNMIFNPNNFGDPYTKETMLWGKFNNDLPTANVSATGGSKIHKLSSTQKIERSTTPEGFAYAFFMANHSNVNTDEKTDNQAPAPAKQQEKKMVRKIRDEKALKEIDAAWEDFFKAGGNLTSGGIDPVKLEKGVKIISLYVKLGVTKFSDIVEDAYQKWGDLVNSMFPELKAAYGAYYNNATDEEADAMDVNIRSVKFNDIIKTQEDANSNQEAETGSGIGTDGQGEPDPGAGRGNTGDPVEGESSGDVQPATEKQTRKTKAKPVNKPVRGQDGDSNVGGDEPGGSERDSLDGPVPGVGNKVEKAATSVELSNFTFKPEYKGEPTFNRKQRYIDNIAALDLLHTLETEKRSATPEEQEVLAKYVGWGGLKQILLDPENDAKWGVKSDQQYRDFVKQSYAAYEKLDPGGKKGYLKAATFSTNNAHYTSIPVIRGIYSILKASGFNGGKVLEPSAGIGNFIAAMPAEMAQNSRFTAVELDPITGKILKQLQQKADVHITGLQDTNLTEGTFDLVISNVPFGDIPVNDKAFKGRKDKRFSQASKSIHNYFFAKSLDLVRPGGLVAFVTSRYTMDSTQNKAVRELISDHAEFMGAIRLPGTAFVDNAGTEVVTDVIFLRRLNKGEAPVKNNDFLNVSSTSITQDGKKYKLDYNKYYHTNPDQMLGKVEAGGLYSENEFFLAGDRRADIQQQIESAAREIFDTPVYRNEKLKNNERIRENAKRWANEGDFERVGNLVSFKDGTIGKVLPEYYVDEALDSQAMAVGVNPDAIREKRLSYFEEKNLENADVDINQFYRRLVDPLRLSKDKKDAAKKLIKMRQAVNKLLYSELNNEPDLVLDPMRSNLNSLYENFVSAHGILNSPSNRAILLKESDGFTLLALEKKNKETGQWVKSDILSKRTVAPIRKVEKVEKLSDGILASYNEFGYIDLTYIASVLGKTEDQILSEEQASDKPLIYRNPGGNIESRTEYLSGNVRKKLVAAKAALESDEQFSSNVRDLEAVQPKDISPTDIHSPIGAEWVPAEYMKQFVRESMGINADIKYNNIYKEWQVNVHGTSPQTDQYKTKRKEFNWVLGHAINGTSPKVTYTEGYGDDKKTYLDEADTTLAKLNIQAISRLWDNWKYSDDERRTHLSRIYNDTYNNSVIPEYDGSHMELPGLTGYNLRPHQKDVVWRMLQTGGGIMDHEVGSGKTLCMAAMAMEGKRLGLHRKPAFIGLKAQVPQAYEEFKRAYPSANILYPTAQDFEAKNRKRLLQQIATNDWDVVMLTHDQFGMLKQDEEIQANELQEILNEINEQIDTETDKRKIQSLEKRREKLEEKIEELSDLKKDRDVLGFHQLGIDFIMVDESQEFKNLEFATKHTDIRGLGNSNGSKRAFNMLIASRSLQQMRGGDKGVLFASGTPISNSISEMYSLFRFLRPSLLKEQGIGTLDGWLRVFAEHDTDLEFYMGKFKDVTRLRRFVNLQELITQYRMLSDVRNKYNLKLDRPEAEHNLVKVQPNDNQLGLMKKLQKYIETKGNDYMAELGLMNGYDDNKKVNPAYAALASTFAKKLSMDPRLINKSYGAGSKIPKAAESIAQIYHDTAEDKGVQLVFCDIGTPKSSNPVVSLYDYLENLGTLPQTDMDLIFGEGFHEKTSKPSMSDVRDRIIKVMEMEADDVDSVIKDSQKEEPFDVYNELKRLLIEKGIKPEEIEFIHSHEGDKKRKALYEKANNGEVRIVLGSTKKLGVGVNIQQRAIAAHHLDIPWKPSDVEQRNGRVERQGNDLAKNKYGNKVPIYYYATERLMDASMYEIVQSKGNFINQAKLGNASARSTEDMTTEFDAGSMAAELSGDPLHKEISQLRKKIRNMENEAAAVKNQKFQLRDNIRNAEKVLELKKQELPKAQEALDLYNSLPKGEDGDPVFTATIGNETFEKVGEAGKKLVQDVKDAIKSSPEGKQFLLGTVYDHFRIIGEVKTMPDASGRQVRVGLGYVETPSGYRLTNQFVFSDNDVSAGVQVKRPITSLSSSFDKIKETISRNEKNLKEYQKQQSEMGNNDTEAELEELRKSLQEKEVQVRENIKNEKAEEDAKAAENADNDQASEEDDQAASKMARKRRIKVAPIEGVKPKKISQIMFDVTKATKQRLFFIKPGRRKTLGTYSPGNTAVKIKYSNDLDTTAHEIGHSLDDHFSIIADLKDTPNPAVEKELKNLASSGGSNPPKGHPDKRMYKLAEGMAEYIRGLVVNPEETTRRYPAVTALYESKVHPEYKKAIADFSTDVRVFAGAKGADIALANMQWDDGEKQGWLEKLFSKWEGNNPFYISFADKIKANYLNPFQAFNKAVEYLQGIKGIDEVLPADDPRLLARAYIHSGAKVSSVLAEGMIDSKLNRLKDDDGNVKNIEWLIAPLDNSDPQTLETEMQETAAYMIAERTGELSMRFGRDTRLTGIGGGIKSDMEAAVQIMEEFNNYDPEKKARIQQAADRYRELADDTLKYMLDKGRISQDVYDKIKENNQYYVGMQRVIEAEPDQEIENYFAAGGGHLGNKSTPLFSIKGSNRKMVNPYVTLLDGVNKAIRESDRNEVLTTFRELLTGTRGMYEGDPVRFADVGVIGKAGDKNSIPIFVDGKVEHWVFQKDVYKTLKGIDYLHHNLPGWATALPRLLRWSVTHFPVFAARNIVRDFQHRMIISNENSISNFFGVKDFVGDKKHWEDVALAGGLNSGFYMKDRVHWYGLMKEAIDKNSKGKSVFTYLNPLKMYNGYSDFLQKGETLNRVAEYRAAFRKAKGEGMDDYNAMLYAGNKSADLIDFALMGHHMKYINQMIPFTNAAVQGLRSSANKFKQNPVGFTARMVLFTVVPQALLWYLNHNDDDKEEYEELPDYQRDMFWNFKIGPNNWVSIPKPFELGILSSGVDRAISSFARENEKAFDGYGGSVAKSFFPVDESAMTGPFRSAIEVEANWDFFRDKSIVPEYEQNLDMRLRKTKYASRLAQIIGNAMGYDSRYVDHIIKSTFSYYGNFATKASNIGTDNSQQLGLPDVGFFKTSPAFNSKSVKDFLEIVERYGFSYKYPEVVQYRELQQKYFSEKTDKGKDQAAKAIREYCKSVLESLKLKGEKEVLQELGERVKPK